MTSAYTLFQRLLVGAERRAMGTITHVSTQEAIAAPTFDDGPDPTYTPRLLDILERHNARGTFFMLGERAEKHPDLVRRIAEAGHAVANHTWSHPRFPAISWRERRSRLRACAKALGPYGQRLFRPPYGAQNRKSRIDALLMGYQVITWSVHAEDWAGHPTEWMAERLAQQIKPGSIVLLHDTLWNPRIVQAADRGPVFEAIDMTLERLAGQMRFITVPELIRRGRPITHQWYKVDDR